MRNGDDKVQKLVKRAKEYDKEAFGELYEIYYRKVLGYVYLRVRNEAEAEDITQKAFIKMLEAIRTFNEDKGSFISWGLSIAHNTAMDFFRSQKRRTDYEVRSDNPGYITIDPVSEFITKTGNDEIWGEVAKLTDEQRNVIFLKFAMGMSGKEIAGIVGKKEGAVKALLLRGLTTLRKRMDTDNDEE